MEIIVFNYKGSKLNLYEVAIMLSYAYIIGDCAACAGSTTEDIYTEEIFKGYNLSNKIWMLKYLCSNDTTNAAIYDNVKDNLENYKYFSKLKHRSSKEIVALKLLEKALAENFEVVTEPWLSFIRNSNIREFISLADGKAFGFYDLDYTNPEKPALPDELTASKLLQRISLDETNGELFFLPSHFFDAAFAENYTITNDNTGGELQPGEIYLHHFFTIPLLQNLKAAELKKTREQLFVAGVRFRNALNELITRCYTANNTTEQPFFTQNVLPAATQFQQQLTQNETIEYCKKIYFSTPQSEIYIGEIPVKLLWDFYKYAEIINNETYSILQQVLQNNDALAKQPWPVMVLKNNAYLSTFRAKTDLPNLTAKTLIAKRYISVD